MAVDGDVCQFVQMLGPRVLGMPELRPCAARDIRLEVPYVVAAISNKE
jgi:hypothetical protein